MAWRKPKEERIKQLYLELPEPKQREVIEWLLNQEKIIYLPEDYFKEIDTTHGKV